MSKPSYQLVVGIYLIFKACIFEVNYSKGIMPENKAAVLIGCMRQRTRELLCQNSACHLAIRLGEIETFIENVRLAVFDIRSI